VQIDPDLRELVGEQGAEGQVLDALHAAPAGRIAGGPGGIRLRPDRMAFRSEREQVDHHGFVIADPVITQKAGLGSPPHADRWAVCLQPRPLDALAQILSERAQGGFCGRVALKYCPQQRTPIISSAVSTLESSELR